MRLFLNIWRTNVKKIKKTQGMLDIVNPIGSYLVDLDSYLSHKDQAKCDVKMFTEEEMAAIGRTKFFKNNMMEPFKLSEILN